VLEGTEQHPHARAVLGGALPPDGTPSHAYLFEGPAGSGKEDVARSFAAALLAEGAPDPASSAARVLSGAHPDLTWVAPTSSAGLLVGDVSEAIVAASSHTPFEARRRVFVVEQADTLNDQAANRMLKTLEEPPPYAHLLLLTARPGKVLPTIASRCQRVRFDAPSPSAIADRLREEGVEALAADACARLALGDHDRARALALGDGPALRAGAEEFARAALDGGLACAPLLQRARDVGAHAGGEVLARTAEEVELVPKKERKKVEREGAERLKRAQRRATQAALDHGLELVGLWLRDLECLRVGAEDLVHNRDRLEQLRDDAAPRDYLLGQELVEETRRRFDLNVSEELALEQLAYRLGAV
jgi:DNA polymerase III subunit delta'